MEISKRPNFRQAYIMANEVLVKSSHISNFPYSATKIVEELLGIQCMSYTRAKSKYGFSARDFGSNDALLVKIENRCILFYNDQNSLKRIRFSILHEVGHLLLDHKFSNEEKLYSLQEIETNYFVGQLLMPEQIIREFIRKGQDITTDFIARTFDVSSSAAEKKLTTLRNLGQFKRNDIEKMYDDIILFKYNGFIDSIIPQSIYSNDWADQDHEYEKERDKWR